MATSFRRAARLRRQVRVRKKLQGTTARPRLNVFRSLEHIYAQVIDDQVGVTLVSASTVDRELRNKVSSLKKFDQAKEIGKVLAERAKAKGIDTVVFDRGGFPYHGRIKALAEGSREGGLIF